MLCSDLDVAWWLFYKVGWLYSQFITVTKLGNLIYNIFLVNNILLDMSLLFKIVIFSVVETK